MGARKLGMAGSRAILHFTGAIDDLHALDPPRKRAKRTPENFIPAKLQVGVLRQQASNAHSSVER
jgi:hypothetical protein